MKKLLYFSLLFLVACRTAPAEVEESMVYAFPGETWTEVSPETMGYDQAKLDLARQYADSIQTAGVMVLVKGNLIYQWGDVAVKYNTHSIRKSFLSALYGKAVKEGIIDLNTTLEEMGIDDEPATSSLACSMVMASRKSEFIIRPFMNHRG